MASHSIMIASSFFPEYLKARIAAGLMFQMISQRSKIDNLSENGSNTVSKITFYFINSFLFTAIAHL